MTERPELYSDASSRCGTHSFLVVRSWSSGTQRHYEASPQLLEFSEGHIGATALGCRMAVRCFPAICVTGKATRLVTRCCFVSRDGPPLCLHKISVPGKGCSTRRCQTLESTVPTVAGTV